ncbi:DUF4421 domain-containing protein [Flavihumibacter profundi]|uniref:DUF4421 domain-containing protein n=1 Tax=Flavihumibacter profundi TaxID=2716883 RepID=UPI001CC491C7|nr:DUF4421 domain-containing protein [Flavihumibacter profundi]MBZ5856506.1 DUF4421 domain-containing protein [Flavihumibacter profundi]
MYLVRYTILKILFGFALIYFPGIIFSQDSALIKRRFGVDTEYIKTFGTEMPVRFFFSQKYTAIELSGAKGIESVRYRPNTTLNIGIGATYKLLTLNLAYGFPFMNRDNQKGDTRYLDLQSHIYTRKLSIDFNGQLYKGYFLFPKGFGNNNSDAYYLRPDLSAKLFGLTVYNMLNGRKFSYRAALLQSEWQQKSSGTWLIGGEVYGGSVSGDSAIIPSQLKEQYAQRNVSTIGFFELGPGVGYAYTIVIKKHFFIMGSATATLDLGFSREFLQEDFRDQLSIRPNLLYRGVIGYSSRLWNLNFSWVGNRIAVRGESTPDLYYFSTGNLRLTLSRRFLPGPRLMKYLKFLDFKPRE